MAKFKVKLKLQGLEIEIEGSKEDIPGITHNLGQQLTGILAPAGAIVADDSYGQIPPATVAASVAPESKRKPRRRSPSASQVTDVTDKADQAIDWRNDTSKFGTPKQGWKTSDKSLWLIHAVGEQTGTKELSGASIAATFNKHFRQAGTIKVGNVNRDLGRLKVKKNGPAVVSEDTTKTPAAWFLTEEGQRAAQKLVGEALGRA